MAMAIINDRNRPDFIDKIDMSNFVPGSQHLVEVTHINDPRSFYVRLISVDHDLEMLEVRGDQIAPEQVVVRTRVIYKSRKLKRYVRGNIEFMEINGKYLQCTIFAIDYGCHDVKVLEKHIYLPASALSINCPPLAVHCQLYLCEPKGETFDDASIDAMKFFVGQHTAKITVMFKKDDRLMVELKTVECPDDVAMMLALLHFTTLVSGPNIINRFYTGQIFAKEIQYKYKSFNIGEKLAVRVQSGSSIEKFYVAAINDYKKYTSNMYEFKEYCLSQPKVDIESAIADSRCCGVRKRQTNNYERGIVLKDIGLGKALTKLVDLGEEIEVLHDDIRYTPSEVYRRLPAIAIYCSSTEDQIWETGLPKFLYPGYQFIIEIAKVGDGLHVPHKVNISPMLRK